MGLYGHHGPLLQSFIIVPKSIKIKTPTPQTKNTHTHTNTNKQRKGFFNQEQRAIRMMPIWANPYDASKLFYDIL